MQKDSTIYGGISGIDLPVEEFGIGSGITLRRTYCHIFAPVMAAFSPAEVGRPHPPPWKSLDHGLSYDITAELSRQNLLDSGPWFALFNAVWLFAALLRLKANIRVIMPVVANQPFGEISTEPNEATIMPFELERHYPLRVTPSPTISMESLSWVKNHWRTTEELMVRSDAFNVAFQAFDQSAFDRSPQVGLVTLWGALERLFSPAQQELTFRVSANIASYLEPHGDSRFELYKATKKLYGARSKAAHGAWDGKPQPFIDTYRLLRRVLIKMIERDHVPNKENLESLMFL